MEPYTIKNENKMSTEGNESRKCTTKSIIEEAEPKEKRGD